MRLVWCFLIGVFFAGFLLLASLPVWVAGLGLTAWAARGEMFNVLAGESVFGLREQDGRLDGRMVNVAFQTVSVPLADDPRPRRLLLRMEIFNADVFAARQGNSRVRVDAWPLDSADAVKAAPLYTLVTPGLGAMAGDDGTLVVDHGGRRSTWSLSDGRWLYDADSAPAIFSAEGERRRVVALSAAEDDLPPGSIAVLTYASSQKVLKRVMVSASDPHRARMLRASVSMIRPVARFEDATHRTIDIGLPAGMVRIPLDGDGLDLAHAQVPTGLGLAELQPWGAAH